MIRVGWIVLAVGLGYVAGCSSSSSKPPGPSELEQAELHDVGGMLHAAASRGKRATKLADVARYHNMFPSGYDAVKSGNVVVLWGTPPLDEGELGKNEKLMAYAKNVPTEGGYVLLSAGTVKKMSASEFNAAQPNTAAK